MSANKYRTSRTMITSALYGYEDASRIRRPVDTEQRAIIADRVGCVIEAIEASPLLREELIACGLSPELISEGLKHHAEFLRDG